jgi:hypothetical protein
MVRTCGRFPLRDRKRHLAKLVGKRRLGIVVSTHTDEDGAAIFRQACAMGLEGIVSKRLSAPYRSGAVEGLAENSCGSRYAQQGPSTQNEWWQAEHELSGRGCLGAVACSSAGRGQRPAANLLAGDRVLVHRS